MKKSTVDQIKFLFRDYMVFNISTDKFTKELSKLGTSDEIKKEVLKQAKNTPYTNSLLIHLCRFIYGKCEIFEKHFSYDPYALQGYACQVLEEKLPEELHNKMLAFYIEDPSDKIIKTYFKIYG